MTAVALFLIVTLIVSRRVRGPLWALAGAWLFCLVPIALGWIQYDFFVDTPAFAMTTIAYLAAYALGCGLWLTLPRHPIIPPDPTAATAEFAAGHAAARLAWWVGLAGTACVIADFALSGGAGLDDLAALRDQVTGRTSASLLAQIGSVLTWGCLYCFIFALLFRRRLRRREFARMLIPIGGYFLLSVFSAGRQASFQIMLLTGLSVAMLRAQRPPDVRRPISRGAIIGVASVAALMISYMGYVAVARNDNAISADKGQVILQLFDAQLGAGTERVLDDLGPSTRSAAIEGMVYFSSSLALFKPYLTIQFPERTYGAVTFPFVFRQLQGITGFSPGALLEDKVDRLSNAGVIGAGWTTGISAMIEDFGSLGAALFLALAGYISMGAWRRALVSADPNAAVLAMVGLLFAVYLPLIPAISDTNIFLLTVFAAGLRLLRAERRLQAAM